MYASGESESTDFDWAVRLHRVLLKTCGLWPEIYENPRKRLLINLYTLMGVLALLLFVLLPQLYGIYYSRYDIFAVVENLQFSASMAGAFIKFLDGWFGKKDLAAVMQEIADDWAKPRDSREREVMVSQAKLSRMIFKVTTLALCVPASVLVALPLLGVKLRYNQDQNERIFPMPSRFFFDVNISPNYELTYFAQTCGSVFAGIFYTGIDNFIVFLILHVQGQLRTLRLRMLVIGRSKTFQSDLVASVNDHIRLRRTISILGSIFARTFAGVLMYFTMTTCMNTLMILHLVQMEDNVATLGLCSSILIMISSIIHSALYCVMGELLISELDEIYNAVCATEWEDLKPDDARKLMIVTIATSRPIYLTAAKIVPMNMATFCGLLRMSGSYVSFLLAQLQ